MLPLGMPRSCRGVDRHAESKSKTSRNEERIRTLVNFDWLTGNTLLEVGFLLCDALNNLVNCISTVSV